MSMMNPFPQPGMIPGPGPMPYSPLTGQGFVGVSQINQDAQMNMLSSAQSTIEASNYTNLSSQQEELSAVVEAGLQQGESFARGVSQGAMSNAKAWMSLATQAA